ncbi:MAG: matrixin family metalloprotease [Acidobacteriota bacterium]
MSLRLRRSLAALTAAVLALACPSGAFASLRAPSDEILARSSAAAVHGRVVAVTSAWEVEVDQIYTYVSLDVVRSWGLDGAPARVVVKQLGGVVGDVAFLVGGQAQFEAGEEVLVFLDMRPRDGTLSVAGLEQGKWMLTGAADPALGALREVRGVDRVSVVARDYHTVGDVEALAALTGTRVRATNAVLLPPLPGAAAPDSAAYTLLSPSNPARWQQADTGAPVYVDTETGGHPQFAGGGLTQLANAANLWRAGGSLALQAGVARSARCFTNSEPNDGRISVTYNDPCGEIADASSVLAIGGAYFTSAGARPVNGITYWSIVKGMIIVDNVASKYAGMTTGCYEEMLTHELGHAIGFGHAAARPAIMYPSISSACYSRTVSAPLGADDLAGMAAVYPGAATPPPVITAPAPPTAFTTSVSGATVTLNWAPGAGGSAATSFQLQAGSAPGASNQAVLNLAATSLVVPNVANGTYYVRIVAMNAAGPSAPTADQAVTVGPAVTRPGAPRSLTTAASPGFVNIAWQAPAGGAAPTSYLILAGPTPGSSLYQVPASGTAIAGPVPAGTYYLRVVALNGAGAGPATSEVMLVVP